MEYRFACNEALLNFTIGLLQEPPMPKMEITGQPLFKTIGEIPEKKRDFLSSDRLNNHKHILTDEDYRLLAEIYGLSPDKNFKIALRVIEIQNQTFDEYL